MKNIFETMWKKPIRTVLILSVLGKVTTKIIRESKRTKK